MGKAKLHLVVAYATEAATIAVLILFLVYKDIVILFFLPVFATITSAFHIMYLLAEIYEKLEKFEVGIRGNVERR